MPHRAWRAGTRIVDFHLVLQVGQLRLMRVQTSSSAESTTAANASARWAVCSSVLTGPELPAAHPRCAIASIDIQCRDSASAFSWGESVQADGGGFARQMLYAPPSRRARGTPATSAWLSVHAARARPPQTPCRPERSETLAAPPRAEPRAAAAVAAGDRADLLK
jgi:hypothetical protein